MTKATFSLNVSYSQICVFWDTLSDPFNKWEQTHVDQGFAWRAGSACFRTIEESGAHSVVVVVSNQEVEVLPRAVRVIEVPFKIGDGVGVEVASIADSVRLNLAVGEYVLRFELLEKDHSGLVPVRLVFMNNASPKFRILRADPELIVPDTLLEIAEPG